MYKLILGDAETELLSLDMAVNCVMCSPPYWGKQKYGSSGLEVGNEKDVSQYVDRLVRIFSKVPLHERGSVWVNIGDKRLDGGGLASIPERFDLKMQENGWRKADCVIWAKVVDFIDGKTSGGCMIEPATGRLNGNGYEYLYRFVKTKKVSDAWTDMCAVGIPRQEGDDVVVKRYLPEELMRVVTSVEGRRPHNVWQVPMGQTSMKHYASYHPALCERPIAMTCPLFVDSKGNPVGDRVVEPIEYSEGRGSRRTFGKYSDMDTGKGGNTGKSGRMDTGRDYIPRKPVTVGWEELPEGAVPGVVLDPFCGTGVTGAVALMMGRSFVGIELYKEYIDYAEERCRNAEACAAKHDVVSLVRCVGEKKGG
jgi:hypothetical protein